MPESSATERADKLREEIVALKSRQYKWGIENSFYMLALKFLGTAFAGAAAIAAVFKDVDRAWTAALVAISGAFFLLLQQLRFSDRANAHFHYSDDLTCLLVEFDCQTSRPIMDTEVRTIAEKYKLIIERHRKVFAAINHFLGQQAPHLERKQKKAAKLD